MLVTFLFSLRFERLIVCGLSNLLLSILYLDWNFLSLKYVYSTDLTVLNRTLHVSCRESTSHRRDKKSHESDDETDSERDSSRSSGSPDSDASDEKQHVDIDDAKQNERTGMSPGTSPLS